MSTEDDKTNPDFPLAAKVDDAIAATDRDDIAPEDIPVPDGECQCEGTKVTIGADGSPFGPEAAQYAGQAVDVVPIVVGRLGSDGQTLLGHFCSQCGCRVEVTPVSPEMEAKFAEAERAAIERQLAETKDV